MSNDAEYQPPFDHSRLKQMVQVFRDATFANNKLAIKDRDYFDGDQISPAMKAELAKRGQPDIYSMKVAPAVGGLLGLIDQAATDCEALPRNRNAADAADIVTKTIRHVADRANYKKLRSVSSKHFIVEGTGAGIVRYERGRIVTDPILWDEFVYDPQSVDPDFEDARWMGTAKLLDEDIARAAYGEAYDKSGNPFETGDFLDFDDHRKKWWSDPIRKQVRVIDIYYEAASGEWHRSIFTGGGIIFQGPSVYHDDQGETVCPIVAVSYEVKRSGERYGAVRHMVPLQDEVNARRSRLLHLTNHRQVQQSDMMANPAHKDIAKREASKADGVMPFGFAPIQAPDLAQGQMLILQKTEADLDRLAPTPAVLGRNGGNESGRARQMLQEAGTTEQRRAFARFEGFELRAYRLMWFIAREYFDEETEIRITGDPKAPEFIKINEPVMGPVQVPAMDPVTGQPAIDPWTGQPQMVTQIGQTGVNNRIAEIDVDVTLTTVPDTVTLAQEVFSTLMEYASANKLDPFDPRFWAMIEMSTMPNKRETIDTLKRLKGEMEQGQAEQAAKVAAMQEAQAQGEMQSVAARTAKDAASAGKLEAETHVIAMQAMMPQAPQPYPPYQPYQPGY